MRNPRKPGFGFEPCRRSKCLFCARHNCSVMMIVKPSTKLSWLPSSASVFALSSGDCEFKSRLWPGAQEGKNWPVLSGKEGWWPIIPLGSQLQRHYPIMVSRLWAHVYKRGRIALSSECLTLHLQQFKKMHTADFACFALPGWWCLGDEEESSDGWEMDTTKSGRNLGDNPPKNNSKTQNQCNYESNTSSEECFP